MKSIIQTLSEELNIKEEYAQNIVNLLDEGNTVTARKCTARWTIRRSAILPTASNI